MLDLFNYHDLVSELLKKANYYRVESNHEHVVKVVYRAILYVTKAALNDQEKFLVKLERGEGEFNIDFYEPHLSKHFD